MSGPNIIFYLLAAFTLVNAILAVTTRQIFRAAIFLLFSLIGVAGLYFWMQYDFIAAAQIVVYVGGITVLIIFSIFLTHWGTSDKQGDFNCDGTVNLADFNILLFNWTG